MQYISVKEAGQQWGLTVRRVQDLCKTGKIAGAVRWGRDWMIPKDALKPGDGRRREVGALTSSVPLLPKKNPAIVMTNLYQIPGSCEQVLDSLSDRPEAATLFRAQIAYSRGDTETACRLANMLLEKPCSHSLQMGCGIVLAMCAVYTGNLSQWKQAKACIQTAKCHHPKDQSLTDFWSAAMDSELSDTTTFPEWFTRGCFDPLPADSFPAARYYYLKYLYVKCHEFTVRSGSQDMMRMFPQVAEPLISQSNKMGSLVSEIYKRLLCAAAYHDLGMEELAIHHLDLAIAHALPDKLYMMLAEHQRSLDFLLDERLRLQDPQAAMTVRAMGKQLHAGWIQLHNGILGRAVSAELTTREREVAKHAAYGLSNKEIAARLNISVNTVKQSLRNAMDKTGALRRNELSHYI